MRTVKHKARAKVMRLSPERASSIVHWGYAPRSSRTPAAKAYARLSDLRALGPMGELADVMRNQAVASFVEAARFAKLGPLARKLEALARYVPGKTWAARNKQLDDTKAVAAVEAVEDWTTRHDDKLTVAMAQIAIDAGWVKDDSQRETRSTGVVTRKSSKAKEGWQLVKRISFEREPATTYFIDAKGDISARVTVKGGVKNVKVLRVGIRREDGWTYTLLDDGVYRTESGWVKQR
jgi:hypothetical protein